jgi:GNAT superfamily N-acetyltransferase
LITREMTARDRRFVVPTWAHNSSYDGKTLPERFDLVDRTIDGGCRVVCLATSDICVHAWAAGDGDALHYVYVPPELRKKGLARRAITALFGSYPERIHCTHKWPRASARFRFAPYRLRTAA